MKKPPGFIPYKLKSFKTYSSPEHMADNQRRYQTVFEKREVDFIWAELALYNKLFDEEDWKLNCKFLLKDLFENKTIAEIPADREVPMEHNILYVREGWGSPNKGAFWKPGSYQWLTYVDNKLLAQKNFYVIDGGFKTPNHNPYFEVVSLRLYEGPNRLIPKNQRRYLQVFQRDKTRYIWAELILRNKFYRKTQEIFKVTGNPSDAVIPIEIQFLFYSASGILKGKIEELLWLSDKDEYLICQRGWGNQEPGSWFYDEYRLEVVFMNRVIAILPFEVADKEQPADPQKNYYFIPGKGGILPVYSKVPSEVVEVNEDALKKALEELDNLVGLESIKAFVKDHINYIKFLKVRKERGLEEEGAIQLHLAFLGNPGTGKTTVARILAKIYKALGLLSKGDLVEVSRADLVAEYIGQTAPKTQEVLKRAKGCVLFIDEAYSLVRDPSDSKDFGREAIEVLIKAMSDSEGDLSVIVAGYPEPMETFLNHNPGFRSRFTHIFHFPDYTPEELLAIARKVAEKRNLKLTPEAWKKVEKIIIDAYRNRDERFGNARFVTSLIDSAKVQLASRLAQKPNFESLTDEELTTVTAEDIDAIFKKQAGKKVDIPIDEPLLQESLKTLRSLIGLHEVKKQIEELVALVRFYREIGKDVQREFPLHTVFMGNPGTGKTTVARLLAQIFRALGLLEKGHLVEADRSKLVAEYLGQTAVKTNKVIDSALGGVLFIDEAYTLYGGEQDSYGKEAIATLLKRMEDQRGEFIVIVAGYPENMRTFLEANPGLRSRFDQYFHFPDYTPEELLEIAIYMFKQEGLELDPSALAHLKNYFLSLYSGRDKYFGNARTVRKVVEKTIKNQHLRLAKLPPHQRTERLLRTITASDVVEFDSETVLFASQRQHATIGFKRRVS